MEKRDDYYDYYTDSHFPDGVPTDGTPTGEECKEQVQERYNVTESDGTQTEKVRTVTVCCEGWTNEPHCDQRIPTTQPPTSEEPSDAAELPLPTQNYTFDPTNPCLGLNCTGVKDAYCAVVSKCGVEYPIFLTEDLGLASCENYPKGQPVDFEALRCTKVCARDPCENAQCKQNRDAICFVSGCSCKAVWVNLDTGMEVDCETGKDILEEDRLRRKREAMQKSGSSCSES